jgi:hypothetical protein
MWTHDKLPSGNLYTFIRPKPGTATKNATMGPWQDLLRMQLYLLCTQLYHTLGPV